MTFALGKLDEAIAIEKFLYQIQLSQVVVVLAQTLFNL
jgi:hypothetical protein